METRANCRQTTAANQVLALEGFTGLTIAGACREFALLVQSGAAPETLCAVAEEFLELFKDVPAAELSPLRRCWQFAVRRRATKLRESKIEALRAEVEAVLPRLAEMSRWEGRHVRYQLRKLDRYSYKHGLTEQVVSQPPLRRASCRARRTSRRRSRTSSSRRARVDSGGDSDPPGEPDGPRRPGGASEVARRQKAAGGLDVPLA